MAKAIDSHEATHGPFNPSHQARKQLDVTPIDGFTNYKVWQRVTPNNGPDFLDTFLVAKLTTVRILPTLATQNQWKLVQVDINNVFLNGVFEEVNMELPLVIQVRGIKWFCKLNRSLYGLYQASRQWIHKLSTTTLKHGFRQSSVDHSLFTIGTSLCLVILFSNVDDIILASPDATLI